MIAPFEVIEPARRETPLVVEVPHAGVYVDPESLAHLAAPAQRIGHDADLYVDELFEDAPSEGATLIFSRVSRYVVDLNRGPNDFDAEAAEGGVATPWPRGTFWRLTTEGEPVAIGKLGKSEVERRLDRFYRPYHRAVTEALERKRKKFGFAVLLCAHSMPSRPRGGVEAAGQRTDLVPGTRGRTSAASDVIDRVDALADRLDWIVRHDDPYKGGFSTGHYGRPSRGVHAIQIEMARRLYMDEGSFTRLPQGFLAVRQFAKNLAARLGFEDVPTARALLGVRGR